MSADSSYARDHSVTASSIAHAGMRCALTSIVVLVALALAVRATGLASDVRDVLGFDFNGVEDTPSEALRIAGYNARFVMGALLCAATARHLSRQVGRLLDATLTLLLAVNASSIGVVFGGYGSRAVAVTALHLPVELAAFSLAGGTYVSARRRRLTVKTLVSVAALSGLLIAGGAMLETCVALRGLR